MMRSAVFSTAQNFGELLRRFSAVLFGIGAIREEAQRGFMHPRRDVIGRRPDLPILDDGISKAGGVSKIGTGLAYHCSLRVSPSYSTRRSVRLFSWLKRPANGCLWCSSKIRCADVAASLKFR